jgi:aconitase B
MKSPGQGRSLPAGPAHAPRAAGVDDAAKVKASFLAAVAHGHREVPAHQPRQGHRAARHHARRLQHQPLIDLLDDAEVGAVAADGLKKTLLMFDQFHDVKEKADKGNANAKEVLQSWADAEWFTSRPEVPQKHHRHGVQGARRNQHRRPVARAGRLEPPRHPAAHAGDAEEPAPRRAFKPEEEGKRGPMKFIEELKAKGHQVAYVGDVVGTGSSRKSATNSVIWATGQDIPFVPNKRFGGVTAWAARSPRSSTTRRKTPARCRSKSTSPSWRWATSSTATLRRHDREGRQGHRALPAQERRAAGRSARRRPHQPDHRPRR